MRFVNTRVYNLISIPQITRLFLGDATISSKTDPRNGCKKEKRSYGIVRINKTMLKLLSFIRILYLKIIIFWNAFLVKIREKFIS